MLQNLGVTAFTVSELLREHQQGGGGGGVVIKILIIQIKVKGVHCDSFETFFVIPETYQLLVLNLRWSS